MAERELSDWKNHCAELELKVEKAEKEAANMKQIGL